MSRGFVRDVLTEAAFWSGSPAFYGYNWVKQRTAREQKEKEHAAMVCGAIRARWFPPTPRYASLAELLRDGGEKLLQRQHEPPELGRPSSVRDIIVIDNFYEDPDAVREYALGLHYEPYEPKMGWFASGSLDRENPGQLRGTRLATPLIKQKLASIVGTELDDATWEQSGEGWNGAFHYKRASVTPIGSSIHNHVGRDDDVRPGGWSGLVYLNPRPPRGAGTSIWMEKSTGKCFSERSIYSNNFDRFEMILDLENRYNRLVLFYASIFHFAARGFGNDVRDARLFQTFFFNVKGAKRWNDGR